MWQLNAGASVPQKFWLITAQALPPARASIMDWKKIVFVCFFSGEVCVICAVFTKRQ
jgi:hypothetical protein